MARHQLNLAWQAVADAYDEDLAYALRARDWAAVALQASPEFVAAVKAKDWVTVGDEEGTLDDAYLLRAALLGSIDSEDAVLDAIRRGDRKQLESVGRIQQAERAAIVNDSYGKVGMP